MSFLTTSFLRLIVHYSMQSVRHWHTAAVPNSMLNASTPCLVISNKETVSLKYFLKNVDLSEFLVREQQVLFVSTVS